MLNTKPKTVDAAIAGLKTAIDNLDAVRAAKVAESDRIAAEIADLEARKKAADDEAARALRVADNVKALLA